MAERYGATPDSALASELFGAERALIGARRARSRRGVLEPERLIARLVSRRGRPKDRSGRARTRRNAACAMHTWRPCSISRSESRPHSSGGTIAPRSVSIFTGSVSLVSRKTMRQPGHVGVDRQARHPEPNRTHHVAGLAPDTGQRHEIVEVDRHLAAESFLDRLRHSDQALGLRAEETRRADQLLDLDGIGVREIGRRRIPGEQRRRHHVDPLVGALRRQDRRDEQLVGCSCFSAHCASGYSSFSNSTTAAARALAPRGRATGEGYPRRRDHRGPRSRRSRRLRDASRRDRGARRGRARSTGTTRSARPSGGISKRPAPTPWAS